jgi:1,4-alpha-glucan branching enzyme
MGGEFAQEREWNHDRSLDWDLLDDPRRQGLQHLVRDLNRLYRENAALFELDCEPGGFEWIDADNAVESIFSYVRRARDGAFLVVLVNFTPVVRHGFRLGVPQGGRYREVINTDAMRYGGSGVVNEQTLESDEIPANGRQISVAVTVPPLAAIVLTHLDEQA